MNYEGLNGLNTKFIELSKEHKSLIDLIYNFFDEASFCNEIVIAEDNISFFSFGYKYELNWNVFCGNNTKYGHLGLFYSYTLFQHVSSGSTSNLNAVFRFYIDSDGYILGEDDLETRQAYCSSESAMKFFRKTMPDAIYDSLLMN